MTNKQYTLAPKFFNTPSKEKTHMLSELIDKVILLHEELMYTYGIPGFQETGVGLLSGLNAHIADRFIAYKMIPDRSNIGFHLPNFYHSQTGEVQDMEGILLMKKVMWRKHLLKRGILFFRRWNLRKTNCDR
jgi:hypothetical protein